MSPEQQQQLLSEHHKLIQKWTEDINLPNITVKLRPSDGLSLSVVQHKGPLMVLAGDWVWEPRLYSNNTSRPILWTNWERPTQDVFLRGIKEFEELHKTPPLYLLVCVTEHFIHFLLLREYAEEWNLTEMRKFPKECSTCTKSVNDHDPHCIFYSGLELPFYWPREGHYSVRLKDVDKQTLMWSVVKHQPNLTVNNQDVVWGVLSPSRRDGETYLSEQDMDFMLSLIDCVDDDFSKERLRRIFSYRVVDTFPILEASDG